MSTRALTYTLIHRRGSRAFFSQVSVRQAREPSAKLEHQKLGEQAREHDTHDQKMAMTQQPLSRTASLPSKPADDARVVQ